MTIRIPDRLAGYLHQLARLGIFGKTPGEIARRFIERGIEKAVIDGFLVKLEIADSDREEEE